MTFFTKAEQTIPTFLWNHNRQGIVKAIQRKKNKAGGIILPDFKLYYKATVIKIIWCWHKNRHIDQWIIIKSPEITPMHAAAAAAKLLQSCPTLCDPIDGSPNSFLIKEAKIANGVRIVFLINGTEKTGHKCKRMTLDYYLTPYVKIDSERIKGLNIRLETIKLPGKNIANKLLGIGTGDYFLNLTPKVNATKAKISKQDYIKRKKLLHSKKKMKK